MKKRSRARIVYEVLSHLAIGGPATVTGLTYIAKMPYDRVERLVGELEVRGLVEVSYEGSSKKVSITEKGLKSLEDLERAIKVLEKLGLD